MSDLVQIQPRLVAPQGKGHTSAVNVPAAWYVACLSTTLKRKPLAVTLLGTPMVLFRDGDGEPHAVLDRCPHRNVPLSLGRVVDGELECAYHGWRFSGAGQCTRVPGLVDQSESRARTVASWPVREQQGLIWVYGDSSEQPSSEPYRFPYVDDDAFHVVYDQLEGQGTLHAVADNALDVPHTSFLHGGLFRQDKARRPIEVVVRRWSDRVEAQYIGEERPKGLIGSILAPGGGEVEHYDRFILPCIVEVEYRLSERSHIVVSTALSPVDDFRTRLFAVVCFKLPLPGWLVTPFIKPIARRIFAQDARILSAQTLAIEQFGGEQFVSTELDALGPHIRKLLRDAERGSVSGSRDPVEKRFTMLV